MFGAILGDIVGSPYEFDPHMRTKDFPLFSEKSHFTDDTVMTLAVADALMRIRNIDSLDKIKERIINSMRKLGNQYPDAGYGKRFSAWLKSDDPKPYNSYGNGAAMRVSSTAWLFYNLASVQNAARLSAEVTHNHRDGIKGAEAIATATFLAHIKRPKVAIKEFVQGAFRYNLSRTCAEIRSSPNRDSVLCQDTVPEAITAFLEANDFEDTIRTAVSLGGDTDTLAAIAGGLAEGFYGMPRSLKVECRRRLPKDLRDILDKFSLTVSGEKYNR